MINGLVNSLKARYNELAYYAKKLDKIEDENVCLIIEGRKMEVYLMIREFGEHFLELTEYNGEEIYGFVI